LWISKRTDYATRAVLALTLDAESDPVKLDDLAARCAAPRSVLEQVMPVLRAAGIVRAERGPHGGYRLNKAPEEISLERVVRLFEGQLAPISCATRHESEHCDMSVGCALREVWERLRDETIDLLERHTFADLAARSGGPWVDVQLLPPSS